MLVVCWFYCYCRVSRDTNVRRCKWFSSGAAAACSWAVDGAKGVLGREKTSRCCRTFLSRSDSNEGFLFFNIFGLAALDENKVNLTLNMKESVHRDQESLVGYFYKRDIKEPVTSFFFLKTVNFRPSFGSFSCCRTQMRLSYRNWHAGLQNSWFHQLQQVPDHHTTTTVFDLVSGLFLL